MTKLKKTAMAFGAACAFAFAGGLAALNTFSVTAQTRAAGQRGYYGAKLSDEIAQAFYDELVEMTVDPDGEGLSEFRTGASHTVDSAVILAAAEGYESDAENGSAKFIKQFGAALDCFRYDYNELFWVNFDRLNFTVTKTENGGTSGGSGSEEGGGTGETDGEETVAQAEGDATSYTYSVTIGAGRAASYFLYGVTPEELNKAKNTEEPTDKGGLMVQYDAAMELLMNGDKSSNPIKKGVNDYVPEGTPTVKEKAIAANQYLVDNFRYGYDFNTDTQVSGVDRFVATTGSIIPSNDSAKPLANSEGFARVYKLILKKLGVEDCELVSGYRMSDGSIRACTWNYVKDGSDWYAVDVAGNLETKNSYLYETGEIFSLDHFENQIVSLSNYKLSYPALRTNNYNVETGELQLADATYEGREGIAVQYKGNAANKLAFRTKDENGVWSDWTTFEAYMLTDGPKEETPDPEPDPNPENPDENPENTPEALADEGDTGDTTEPGTTEPGTTEPGTTEPGTTEPDPKPVEPTYNIALKDGIYYLFNLTKGAFRIGVLDTNGNCVEYTETVKESFGNGVVPISLTSNPERLEAQDITKPLSVTITFRTDLKQIDASVPVGIEYTVSSVIGEEIHEEFIKSNCKLENINWSSTGNTLSFKFTPSALMAHNGLKYTFTVTNLAEVDTNAVPQPYSVVFQFKGIRAGGLYFGSNLYTDVVALPSLVYNNDASFVGWKYLTTDTQGNEMENPVTENMLSTFALSVAKPVASADAAVTEAVKARIAGDTAKFNEGAYLASANYITDLTLEGHAVKAGEDGYLTIAFPYPEGYGPEKKDVSYRLVQFGKTDSGEIDYENLTLIDAMPLRQGVVACVNSFSTFAVVAIDSGKIKSQYANSSTRMVYTMTTGVGGKVETSSHKAINTAEKSGDSIIYTLTADAGYELAFITLNGKTVNAVPTSEEGAANKVYRFSIQYNEMVIGSYPSANNVLNVEFVATAAKDDIEVGKTAATNFVNKQLSQTAYSDAEKAEIIKDFPSGGTVYVPETPPIEDPEVPFNPNSTQMQYIIVGGVVGAFVVIGFIVIIYCGAIKPRIVREREEEAARIAANRERRANRNRVQPVRNLPPNDPNSKK